MSSDTKWRLVTVFLVLVLVTNAYYQGYVAGRERGRRIGEDLEHLRMLVEQEDIRRMNEHIKAVEQRDPVPPQPPDARKDGQP